MAAKRNSLIQHILPLWTKNHKPDANHFFRRGYTREYAIKKKAIYYLWIVILGAMLVNPTMSVVITLGLLATFGSFMILDEVGDDQSDTDNG